MKIKSIATVAAAAVICLSSSLAVSETKEPGSGPNPFVDCGIGAALFPTVHWAAVTSNAIWDVGTTAVTSATASPETCQGSKEVEAAQFILDTYDSLVEESSQGQGEHLMAVMSIMSCNVAAQGAVVSDIRQGMADHLMASGYDKQSKIEKAAALYSVVDAATQVCSA